MNDTVLYSDTLRHLTLRHHAFVRAYIYIGTMNTRRIPVYTFNISYHADLPAITAAHTQNACFEGRAHATRAPSRFKVEVVLITQLLQNMVAPIFH